MVKVEKLNKARKEQKIQERIKRKRKISMNVRDR